MDIDRPSRWITLAANLAVVTGIIFLAYELCQNNKLLEAQARATQSANRLTYNDPLLVPENSALKVKARSGDPLTDDEIFRYESLKHALFVSRESDYLEFREGLIEDLPTKAMRRSLNTYAGLLDAWRSRGNFYNEDFVTFVENKVIDGVNEYRTPLMLTTTK